MMKVTQADIATHLNLSRLTVSKVLNNASGVSVETRKRVFDAAVELGYSYFERNQIGEIGKVISQYKKDLNTNTNMISLFLNLELVSDSYWAPVMRGMVGVLNEYGHKLNLCFLYLTDDEELSFPANFNLDETCGIIRFGRFKDHQIRRLNQCGLPLVSIDTTCDEKGMEINSDIIMNANVEPMAKLIEYLVDAGYRKIGYLGERTELLTMRERWDGFCAGMASAGLDLNERFCFFGSVNEIIKTMREEKRLDNLDDFPEILVCCNDLNAVAVSQYLQSEGVLIPKQVSITGFDNTEQSEVAGITTINVNKEELGAIAAETLLWRIQNPDRPYRIIRLYDNEFIVRNSTR
jgi:LacI family transcriptional regulator